MIYKNLLCIIALICNYSFASTEKANPTVLEIIGKNKISFNLIDSELVTKTPQVVMPDQGYQVMYFKLPSVDLKFSSIQIQRRKQSFAQYFTDQIEPYTGSKTERSKCLKSQDERSITFLANDLVDWGNCDSKKSNLAQRIWMACNKSLWEVTVLAPSNDKFSLNIHCKN